jgi:hypothetical protein
MKKSNGKFLFRISYEWKIMTFFEKAVTIATLLSLFMSGAALIAESLRKDATVPMQIILTQNGIIIIVVVVLLLFYYSKYLKESYRNQSSEKVYEVIGAEFHKMAHDNRNLMISVESQPQNISTHDASGILIDYCDYIKNILEAMFQGKITFHVAMKAFISEEAVVTIARDRITLDHVGKEDILLRHNDIVFEVKENSSFDRLLASKKKAFASDNLLKDKDYDNTSPNWCNKYTATMVVPIRRNYVNNDSLFEIAGYIGVDCIPSDDYSGVFCSKSGEPKLFLKNLLLSFADTSFGIIKRGKIADHDNCKLPKKEYVVDSDNFDFIKRLNEDLNG